MLRKRSSTDPRPHNTYRLPSESVAQHNLYRTRTVLVGSTSQPAERRDRSAGAGYIGVRKSVYDMIEGVEEICADHQPVALERHLKVLGNADVKSFHAVQVKCITAQEAATKVIGVSGAECLGRK